MAVTAPMAPLVVPLSYRESPPLAPLLSLRSWALKVQDKDHSWSKRSEEATQRWATASAAKEEEWALAKGSMEAAHTAALRETNPTAGINNESRGGLKNRWSHWKIIVAMDDRFIDTFRASLTLVLLF